MVLSNNGFLRAFILLSILVSTTCIRPVKSMCLRGLLPLARRYMPACQQLALSRHSYQGHGFWLKL